MKRVDDVPRLIERIDRHLGDAVEPNLSETQTFGRRAEVLASFQWETLMLCSMGGIVGAALSLVFNGYQTGTANFQPISDLSFASILPGLMLQGVAFRIVMEMVGGFPPAWRASRIPVTEAMKGG